jgi:hypothetical protein
VVKRSVKEKTRNRTWDSSRAGNKTGGVISWRDIKTFIGLYDL